MENKTEIKKITNTNSTNSNIIKKKVYDMAKKSL